MPPHSYRFGLFELDPRSGELRRDGQLIRRLQDQPLRVLVSLVERPGELLTREELRAKVWPDDMHVDFDHGLHAIINRLREALGDSADQGRFIQTVPRRGYRFVAPVASFGDDPAPGASAAPVLDSSPSSPPEGRTHRMSRLALGIGALAALVAGVPWVASRSGSPHADRAVMRVAVLPLDNLTGDPEQAVFVDGLHEELIVRLGLVQPQRLAVVARTSVMGYREAPKTVAEVSRELSVDYILEGSVRRQDARFRITAQLIRGDDESHVWTETYDRSWSDLLSLEADIAARVADALAIELLPAFQARVAHDRRIRQTAYENYLRGRFYWNQRIRDRANLARAESALLSAIAEQPEYAVAYVALADTYDSMIFSRTAPASMVLDKARAAVARALELDPTLAAAHATSAFIAMHFDRDWAGAEQAFERSIRLNANDALTRMRFAQMLTVRRRFADAEREVAAARALDPLAADVVEFEAWVAWYQRAETRALRLMERSAELDANPVRARAFDAYVFAANDDCDLARATLQRLEEIAGVAPATAEASYAIGRCVGDDTRVAAAIRELSANGATFARAMLYYGLGDLDRYFELLDQAEGERDPQVLWVGLDPALASTFEDPRLRTFLATLGLE